MLGYVDTPTLTSDNKSGRRSLQNYQKNEDIPSLIDRSCTAYRLSSGLACRYQLFFSGRRQITAVIVPGDVFDFEVPEMTWKGCGFAALARCEVELQHIDFDGRTRCLLKSDAIARQWLVSLGQRSALQRLAHLLCELNTRLGRVKLH